MAYIGVQPTDTYLSIASQQITGNGGATYTLNYSVSDEESLAVFVNNVRQNVSSYTVSGTSLTLGGTISVSDECWVLFLGRTVGTKTPAVGSVTNDMLQNSSITLNGSAVSLGGSATVGGTNTPAFEAHLSGSDQNLLLNVDTKIQFNTKIFDTDGCYDNTTNYRFTPTVAGKYFVYATFRVTNNQSSLQYLAGNIQKNGSVYKTLIQDDRNNYGFQASLTISIIVDMNGTTDYLEGFAKVGVQGGTISMKSSDKCNSFGAYKLIGA